MGMIGEDPKLRAQLEKARIRSRLRPTDITTKESAASLIESCRQGTAPLRGARVLSIGRETLIQTMNDDLLSVAEHGSRLMVVNGEFGIGKTLTLRVLQEHAHDHRFATGFLTLSQRECPMFDLAAIYRSVVKSIRVGDCLERSALEHVLARWSKEIAKDQKREIIVRYLQREVAIPRHVMPWGVRDLDDNFKTVLAKYYEGMWLGNREKTDLALRWLRGESTAIQARHLGTNYNMNAQNALHMLGNLTKMLRFVGLKGLVILLDEADAIPSLPNTVLKEQSYQNLLNLSRAASSTPYSYFVYATTPSFFGSIPSGFEDALRNVHTLEPLDARELLEVTQTILDLHYKAYEWHNHKINKSSLKWFVHRCQTKAIYTPREFVRTFISILDICEENRTLTIEEIFRQ